MSMEKLTLLFSFIICVIVIGCVTALNIYALKKGIDGKVLVACVSILTGILGYNIKKFKIFFSRKGNEKNVARNNN